MDKKPILNGQPEFNTLIGTSQLPDIKGVVNPELKIEGVKKAKEERVKRDAEIKAEWENKSLIEQYQTYKLDEDVIASANERQRIMSSPEFQIKEEGFKKVDAYNEMLKHNFTEEQIGDFLPLVNSKAGLDKAITEIKAVNERREMINSGGLLNNLVLGAMTVAGDPTTYAFGAGSLAALGKTAYKLGNVGRLTAGEMIATGAQGSALDYNSYNRSGYDTLVETATAGLGSYAIGKLGEKLFTKHPDIVDNIDRHEVFNAETVANNDLVRRAFNDKPIDNNFDNINNLVNSKLEGIDVKENIHDLINASIDLNAEAKLNGTLRRGLTDQDIADAVVSSITKQEDITSSLQKTTSMISDYERIMAKNEAERTLKENMFTTFFDKIGKKISIDESRTMEREIADSGLPKEQQDELRLIVDKMFVNKNNFGQTFSMTEKAMNRTDAEVSKFNMLKDKTLSGIHAFFNMDKFDIETNALYKDLFNKLYDGKQIDELRANKVLTHDQFLFDVADGLNTGKLNLDDLTPEIRDLMQYTRDLNLKKVGDLNKLGRSINDSSNIYTPQVWDLENIESLVKKDRDSLHKLFTESMINANVLKKGNELTDKATKLWGRIADKFIERFEAQAQNVKHGFEDMTQHIEDEINDSIRKMISEGKLSNEEIDILSKSAGFEKADNKKMTFEYRRIDKDLNHKVKFKDGVERSLKDVMNTNFSSIIEGHHRKINHMIEMERDPFVTFNGKQYDIRDIKSMEKLATDAKLRKAGTPSAFEDLMTGAIRSGFNRPKGSKQALSTVNTLNSGINAWMLGASSMYNIVEMAGVAASKASLGLFKKAPEIRQIIKEVIQSGDETVLSNIEFMLNKDMYSSVYSKTLGETGNKLGTLENLFTKMGDVMINKIGQQGRTTSFNRELSFWGTFSEMIDRTLKGKQLFSNEKLAQLGITSDELKSIQDIIVKSNGDMREFNKIISQAQYKAEANAFTNMMMRAVDMDVINNKLGTNVISVFGARVDNPLGKLVMHLKTFLSKSLNTFLINPIRATRSADDAIYEAKKLFGHSIAATALYIWQTETKFKGDNEKIKKRYEAENLTKGVLSNIPSTSLAAYAYNTIADPITYALTGETKNNSSSTTSGLQNNLYPTSLRAGQTIASEAVKQIHKKIDGENNNDKLAKALTPQFLGKNELFSIFADEEVKKY